MNVAQGKKVTGVPQFSSKVGVTVWQKTSWNDADPAHMFIYGPQVTAEPALLTFSVIATISSRVM